MSYVELGRHQKKFQNKPAVYESGMNKGKIKPPELFVSLTFEFSGVEHSGDYPHTYETSIMLQDGGFMNPLSVSDDFIQNKLSLAFANKVGYKKLLDAINLHCKQKFQGLHQAVGTAIHVAAKTKAFKKIENAKDIQCLDTEVPGFDPENPTKNIEGWRYYVGFKPENIQPMKMQFGQTVVDMSEYIKHTIGDYTPVFDWDAPTKEAWTKLKPWQKRAISKALDLETSAFGTLMKVDAEIAAEVQAYKTGAAKQDQPQEQLESDKVPSVPPVMQEPVSDTPADDLPV